MLVNAYNEQITTFENIPLLRREVVSTKMENIFAELLLSERMK